MGEPLLRISVLAVVVVAAMAGTAAAQKLAPGYGVLDFAPPAAGSYRLPALGPAADGRVVTTAGQAVTLHRLFGPELTLLSFVYLGCGDVNGCPLATHVLQKTLRAVKRDPELDGRLRAISLSFDPVNDTPAALERQSHWFRQEHPNWLFATTASEADLQPLLAAYGQNRILEFDAKGQRNGVFAHTLRVFLVDRERRIRNIYSVDFLHPDLLINDLKTVLQEADVRQSSQPGDRLRSPPGGSATLELPLSQPLGLPPIPVPADNPLTEEKISLGERLFFDRRLSLNNTLSCAMCHIAAQGFANNEMATAVGFEGRTVRRNAPTIYNVAYVETLFHDGRESTLEQQVWQPLLATNEMANPSIGTVIDKIRDLPEYSGLFEAAFGRGPGMETVGQALASYQRTLLLANSGFDRWRYGGETDALSDGAKAGFALFSGRAGCSDCHQIGDQAALFTDHQYHNTGIGWYQTMRPAPLSHRVQLAPGVFVEVESAIIEAASETPPSDLGRYEITQDPVDRWRYRTPSLRNVALTAPYMHNGTLQNLDDVVRYYNDGGYPHPQLDRRIKPLNLSAAERSQLVAFLISLTGDPADHALQLARAAAAPIGDVSAAAPIDGARAADKPLSNSLPID